MFKNIVVYFLCNAKYAKNVLESETKMSAMMPCAWSIYEKNDGNTYISKMNIGLMINFFSGVVKETMGNVEKTEIETATKWNAALTKGSRNYC